MAKYYALIAGLPNITVDSPKPPFTTASFVRRTPPILTKQDLQSLEVLRQEALNKELLNWIVEGELTPPEQEPEQSYEVDYSGEAAEALSPEIIRLQALQSVSAAANQGKRNPAPQGGPRLYLSLRL